MHHQIVLIQRVSRCVGNESRRTQWRRMDFLLQLPPYFWKDWLNHIRFLLEQGTWPTNTMWQMFMAPGKLTRESPQSLPGSVSSPPWYIRCEFWEEEPTPLQYRGRYRLGRLNLVSRFSVSRPSRHIWAHIFMEGVGLSHPVPKRHLRRRVDVFVRKHPGTRQEQGERSGHIPRIVPGLINKRAERL